METDHHKIFDQDLLKKNLTLASMYLVAFELLKTSIIDSIISFLSNEYRDGKHIISKAYEEDVGKVDAQNSRLKLSCEWLKKNGAITEDDIADIFKIKDHRNKIAHELVSILSTDGVDIEMDNFRKISELVNKIDLWWLVNVELPITQPEIDVQAVSEAKSGRMIALEYLLTSVSAL